MTRDEPCAGSEGVATPYGESDTWPDVEGPSFPRRPVDQPLTPVAWIEYGQCGYGWGG